MDNSRRTFLKQLAATVAPMPSLTPLSLGPTVVEATDTTPGTLQNASNRTLMVVQLMGGNDGLNTVVPYSQAAYYNNRPTLGLKQNEILQVDGDVALNASMSGMMDLYKNNRVSIIQGVSYPNPNLSHYEATAIWESGAPDMPFTNGWLGRYLDVAKKLDSTTTAVSLGDILPQALDGATSTALSVSSVQRFRLVPLSRNDTTSQNAIEQLNEIACNSCKEYNSLVTQMMKAGLDALSASSIINQAASNYSPSVQYPNNDFANRLKLAAGIITSSMKPRIVYVTLGGFDTHANQKVTQNNLLKTLSDGISAFYNDMVAHGRANDTLIMTFSEFGRRVKENGNRGTDHGTAEPQFFVGGKVSHGLYGTYPILTDLDRFGNLKYKVDFRQTYASVLEDWFGIDQTEVLRSKFDKLTVFQ